MVVMQIRCVLVVASCGIEAVMCVCACFGRLVPCCSVALYGCILCCDSVCDGLRGVVSCCGDVGMVV